MYKLVAVDYNDKYIDFYKNEDIFVIDCITGEFNNREELLEVLGDEFDTKIKNVFIIYNSNEKERIIKDIAYSNVDIPSEEVMEKIYTQFLREKPERIGKSYLRKLFEFSENVDISFVLKGKFKPYRTRRECYFHMVREGKIKLTELQSHEPDYLKSIIDNIDTDDMSDQSIMIEKIKSGEIEPYFYDIDDYVTMKRNKR